MAAEHRHDVKCLGESSKGPHPCRSSCGAEIAEPGTSGNISHLRAMQAKARRRADEAMRAYTDALGELREDMQASPFDTWTLEQLQIKDHTVPMVLDKRCHLLRPEHVTSQEFLVDHGLELRGANMLSRASFVAILEKMFKGCTEPPQPPAPLTDEFKQKREAAARVVQDRWFVKKRQRWTQAMARPAPDLDGHLRANPLQSPKGVMRAAVRGRISEDTPWAPPSLDVARAFADGLHPRRPEGGQFEFLEAKTGRYCFLGGCGEQLDLWDEGKISQFAPYGAGVTSYFKFLKFCSWSFLIVSAAVLPHLLINTNGGGIPLVSTNTDRMSWTTVGNLGSSLNYTEVLLPFCDEEQFSTCVLEKETLGMYYGYIDAAMVILILVGYFWVHAFITDEFLTIKRNTVTAGDFTIMVKNIPESITEAELSEHFGRVLNRTVVEVAIARDNRRCISLYNQSGKLYHQRAATRDMIRYLKTRARTRESRLQLMEEAGEGKRSGANVKEGCLAKWRRARKIRQLQEKRTKASRQIINLAAEAKLAAKTMNMAVAAYVTFEEEMGAVEARVQYSGSWISWLFMRKSMRLKGRRLVVTEAPEPSTILWENFGYRSYELTLRRCFTFVVGLSFLTMSIAMSIWALYRNQVAEREGGTATCPQDWDALDSEAQLDAVTEDPSILHCLCADQISSVLTLDTEDVCFEYAMAKIEAAWLVFATSLMVAFTNAGINKMSKMMGAFEKHKSMDTQEVSTFRRLVLLKFVNIGLTVLVTNSRRVINLLQVDLDYEEDFTPDWYRTLGTSLVMNVLINAVTPHLYWLVMWARKVHRWKQVKGGTTRVISQDALNNMARGGRWEISHRYAEVTVIFAVCLAYSAGIPLLLPVGAVSFLVFYWVEKALFVRFYVTPPQYSGKLTNEVINLIPYCLWVHTVFAFYMYGNGSVFPVHVSEDQTAEDAVAGTSDTFNFVDKLKVKAVQPLVVPFLILSALIAERWLGSTIVSIFARIVAFLTCKGKITSRKLERMCNAVTVDYSRAVVRGILRGLPSYNILLNPKYKDSFGLSDSFAAQHKRVGSIFMMLEEHPSILDVKKTMLEKNALRHTGRSAGWSPRFSSATGGQRMTAPGSPTPSPGRPSDGQHILSREHDREGAEATLRHGKPGPLFSHGHSVNLAPTVPALLHDGRTPATPSPVRPEFVDVSVAANGDASSASRRGPTSRGTPGGKTGDVFSDEDSEDSGDCSHAGEVREFRGENSTE